MAKRSETNVEVGDLVEHSYFPMYEDWENLNERILTGVVLEIRKVKYFLRDSFSFDTGFELRADVHWFKVDKDQRHLADDDPNKTLTNYEDEEDFTKKLSGAPFLVPLSNLVILHKN